MRNIYTKGIFLAMGYLLMAGAMISTGQAIGFGEALVAGEVNVDMRLRYEVVDDRINRDAKAATLRTRLGYRTVDYKGVYAFAEFKDVRTVLGVDEYEPQRSGYAVVADPPVTQLNRALLGYTGLPWTTIELGRQRIKLDNDRFVGNVGWRQNEQTFDALSLVNTSLPNIVVTYAFLDRVHGVLEKFDADVTNHLLNIAYSGFRLGKLVGYAYLFEDDASGARNDTYGVRFSGGIGFPTDRKLVYTAELASQSTDINNTTYVFLEGGVQYRGITAKLGYEVLGSDGGSYGFQTPLATKHAFNGWADLFLVTPDGGLVDAMLSIGGRLARIELLGVYHDYTADEGGADYGSELNLLAIRKFGERYLLGFKYASYRAVTWKTDTDKLWLWAQLRI